MTALIGVFFHWIGGLAAGSFYVPFKKVKSWSWETYWLIAGIASWLICPTLFALILSKAPFQAISAVDAEVIKNTFICGLLWGVGGLTFGLSMRYLGVSLGNAIALGFCTVFGTLIPPLKKGDFIEKILTPLDGKIVLLGVLVAVIGIGLAGKAGMEKEKGSGKGSVKEFHFTKGVIIAAFAGIMSAFMVFGFTEGEQIHLQSSALGSDQKWARLPILIVVMAGGLTTNFFWCLYLHFKNKSAGEYWKISQTEEHGKLSRNYLFSLLAGVVWYLQFFFYSLAESYMGKFDFASWTLHMASIIIFSSLWGLRLGEWKGAPQKAVRFLYLALMTLIFSTVIIGIAAWVGKGGATH